MNKLIYSFLLVISFSFGAFAADQVYVYATNMSEKNIKELQLIADQYPGVKYAGFCQDLSVAQFYVDRTVQPDDSIMFVIFKKFGLTEFSIQTPVEQERFLSACKRFQPRN